MENCLTCQKPKATLECALCESPICKSCTQYLDDDSFSFLKQIPAELIHRTYCTNCFDEKVSDPLNAYLETMEAAKNVLVFYKNQGKMTRLMKRKEDPVQVVDCHDKDETLLRLAFFAAQAKFNSIIDVDIVAKKIINGSHKSLIFSGTGIPYQCDTKMLNRTE
jgi:hypothetical protein